MSFLVSRVAVHPPSPSGWPSGGARASWRSGGPACSGGR